MTPQELQTLIASTETDRVEKPRSTTDVDKFREAICSFSNDMAGTGRSGYLLIGVDEKDPGFRLEAARCAFAAVCLLSLGWPGDAAAGHDGCRTSAPRWRG